MYCRHFNFTNLWNEEWGKRYFVCNDNVPLIDFEGFAADGTTPEYSFCPNALNSINQIDDAGLQSTRWRMQLGI